MKKVLLLVLDGFGIRKESHGNAVLASDMPNFNELMKLYPNTTLEASGTAVGLPEGQMGNSEVGHISLGAGRLIKQNIAQIESMFEEGLKDNQTYNDMVNYVKENNKPLHLMALVSDGAIHSKLSFILEMIDNLYKDGVKEVYVHAITDGRDSDPHSAYSYIKQVEDKLNKYNIGKVVSICGRYYAMDRDKKYQRTKYYSDMVVLGKGFKVSNIDSAIKVCYKKNVTDEFLPPLLLDEKHIIKDGDALLWFNYRADRAKQILKVITDNTFNEYETKALENLKVYTIYEVEEAKNSKHLLERVDVTNSLGEYLSKLGLTQARIAETEKYAHVTYFFDGGKEIDLEGCDRFLIPSPKVATYDLVPEMSTKEISKQILKCMNNNYDFIFANYASPDMVGHTGNFEATVKALEVVDQCLGAVLESADENFYTVFIVGDHGNCDYMLDENDNIVTTHSTSVVPFITTDKKLKLVQGSITSVAPTILKYMDIKIPKEMQESKLLTK